MITALIGNEVIATQDCYFAGQLILQEGESYVITKVFYSENEGKLIFYLNLNADHLFSESSNYLRDYHELSSKNIIDWPVEPEPNEK